MNVLVCGLSGSGKSVMAERLAEHFGLKCVHTSGVLRQLREEKKMEVEASEMNVGFYESKEGKKFMKERLENQAFDKALDKKLLEIIEEDNVVMDSWTMPWLSPKGIKIWLRVSDKERAERLAGRNKREEARVLKAAKEKGRNTAKIYKKLYGFDFGKDLSVFDLIVESDKKSIEEVFQEIKSFLEKKAA